MEAIVKVENSARGYHHLGSMVKIPSMIRRKATVMLSGLLIQGDPDIVRAMCEIRGSLVAQARVEAVFFPAVADRLMGEAKSRLQAESVACLEAVHRIQNDDSRLQRGVNCETEEETAI